MKLINDNDILKVKAVKNLEDVKIINYQKDVWIAEIEDEYYMIIKRCFNNEYNKNKIIDLENAVCKIHSLNENLEDLKLNIEYGDEDAIIVDMHGIDNFRFAKSLVFHDDTVRKIILKLNLLNKNEQYLRIGCSGARECEFHPGGEVYETSLINGKDGSGISQSVSGYLPDGKYYSKSISLYDEDMKTLREERIVYLHTALLKKCGIKNSKCIYVNIKPIKDNVSLLDILTELATKLGLSSYAIQVCVQTNNKNKHFTEIKGRVLRHMPLKPFNILQDATDIGLEKLFRLNDNDIMYGVGTKYNRYEPEWKEFTGGRQYERRGHIHSTIVTNGEKLTDRHEVFHLRDAFVSPASDIQVVFTPVNNTYKIYPIYKIEEKFYCKTTDKDINIIVENIRREDSEI